MFPGLTHNQYEQEPAADTDWMIAIDHARQTVENEARKKANRG